MPREQNGAAFFPSMAAEVLGVGGQQVHGNQTIHHVGKLGIDINADQAGIQFQLVFKQNGQAFAIALEGGDRMADGLHVFKGRHREVTLRHRPPAISQGTAGFHQTQESEIIVILPQVALHETAGQIGGLL